MKKQWQQSYRCNLHKKPVCSVCYNVYCLKNRFVCPDCFTKQIHDHNQEVTDITNFENNICSQQMHHQHYIKELKNIKKQFIGQIDKIESSNSDNVNLSYQSLRYLKSQQFSKYITYLFSNEESKMKSLEILKNSFNIFLKQMEKFAEGSKLVEEMSFKTQILDGLNGEGSQSFQPSKKRLQILKILNQTQNLLINRSTEKYKLNSNQDLNYNKKISYISIIEWNSLQEAEEIFELILELRPQNEEAIC